MRTSSVDHSDPIQNRQFRRRWTEKPTTSREMQHLADLEAAHGNARRAELLSWRAHMLRAAGGASA